MDCFVKNASGNCLSEPFIVPRSDVFGIIVYNREMMRKKYNRNSVERRRVSPMLNYRRYCGQLQVDNRRVTTQGADE